MAYAAALAGGLAASEVVVVTAGRARAGSADPARVAEAVRSFALSLPGLSSVAACNGLVLVAVSLFTARLSGGGVAATLRLGPSKASPAGLLAAVAGTVGLSLACGSAADLVVAGQGAVLGAIAEALRGASPGGLAMAIAALCLLPGVAEEMLFRGLVQTRLGLRWGRAVGLVVAAAAFGLMHLDPVQGTIAFAVGLYLGAVANRLQSIRPSMLAHAANNSLFVGLGALSPSSERPGRAASLAVLAVGLAVCAASALLLRSRRALRVVAGD